MTIDNIAVIIVTYNNEDEIGNCIRSILVQRTIGLWPKQSLKIFIVDNASEDNTLNIIRNKFRNIEIIANRKNVGFAKAVNQGIKQALKLGVDYICLLNPDAKFIKGGIKELIQSFKLINKVGIVAPVIKDINDKFGYVLGLSWNRVIGRTEHLRVNKLPNNPVEQEMVSGCCLLISKEILLKAGKFDEQFFMYFEDVDFCLRVKKLGYKIFINPNTIILHNKNIESIKFKTSSLKYFINSHYRFIIKHVQWYYWPLAFIYLGLLIIKIMINLR